ncbi:MAG: type II secretion system protein [Gallionellaceae bacterium]
MIRQRGVSLVELIMFIVIIGIALVSLLGLMNTLTRDSVDPMIRKQALAVAESLLEEIELQDFSSSAATAGAVNTGNRSDYHIVSEYNNFTMTGITSLNGTAVSGLSGYIANVAVSSPVLPPCLPGVTAASQAIITVTVNSPAGEAIRSVGCVVDLGPQ